MSWTTREAADIWTRIGAVVDQHARGTFLKLAKRGLPHPRDAGAELSFGLPLGQRADFRFPPARDGTGLHVHELDHAWIVHRGAVHACHEQPCHDAPFAVTSASVGAALGAALGRGQRSSMVAGLGVGLLFAGLTLLAAEAKQKRRQQERRLDPSRFDSLSEIKRVTVKVPAPDDVDNPT